MRRCHKIDGEPPNLRGQGSVLCHNEAVLRWLISVGGLHSGGDKELSIFGVFFVREVQISERGLLATKCQACPN